jgi:hypothetical protein
MNRRIALAALAVTSILGAPAVAHATDPLLPALSVIGGTSFTLNPMNDFHAGGAATGGARLALTGPAQITFRLLNAEAGLNNAFEYRGASLFSNADLASGTGLSRTLSADAGLLDFGFRMPATDAALSMVTNAGNGPRTLPSFAVTMLGDHRARILLDDNGGASSGLASLDDDFDDMVLEVSVDAVTPVPEPAEWMILSAGLAFAAGLARRRRARAA